MKQLLLFLLAMVLSLPQAYAFDWHKDVDTITATPDKIYECYPGMSLNDLHATWSDVPGWKLVTWEKPGYQGVRMATFNKIPDKGDKFIETFQAAHDYGSPKVFAIYVTFSTNDANLANEMYSYAVEKMTESVGTPIRRDNMIQHMAVKLTETTWSPEGHHYSCILSEGKAYPENYRYHVAIHQYS